VLTQIFSLPGFPFLALKSIPRLVWSDQTDFVRKTAVFPTWYGLAKWTCASVQESSSVNTVYPIQWRAPEKELESNRRMDLIGIFTCLALVGAIGFTVAYGLKRTAVTAQLSAQQNPPPIKTPLSVGDALKKVRAVLKHQSFVSRKWSIKEDNPNGMLIAILTFEEDLGNQAAVAKRQLILTISIIVEDEITLVRLMYSVYAPFGRTTCNAVLEETTAAIENVVQQQ
jgi:hypothetical protein